MTIEQECIIQAWAKKMCYKPIELKTQIKKGTISSVRHKLKPIENGTKI